MSSIRKLPSLRKPPAIKKIRKTKRLPSPARIRDEPLTADMSDKERRAYYNTCGEPEERKKIVDRFSALLETEPAMTYPEAIVYWMLEKRGLKFYYQTSYEGGRTELGGLVVDFLVDVGGIGVALQVQGNFWHNKPEQRERDLLVNERVVGMRYADMVIDVVVELWESKLMSCEREETMDAALLGIEMGQ